MRLNLMGWDQGGQDHPSLLVVIALTKDLLDASKGVSDKFRCILGGYREGEGHGTSVLRCIGKTIRRQEDGQDPSGYLVLWFDRIRGGLAPHKMAPSI